jgi:tyrosine aminotransferase
VDNLKPPTHHPPSKPLLSLSLGDPTVFGNLPCPEVLTRAIVDNATAAKHNGYVPSAGLPSARKALARAYSYEEVKLSEEVRRARDVVLEGRLPRLTACSSDRT